MKFNFSFIKIQQHCNIRVFAIIILLCHLHGAFLLAGTVVNRDSLEKQLSAPLQTQDHQITPSQTTVCPGTETVQWHYVTNAAITSNNGLICTTDNGWSVGAESVQQITGENGYVEYTVDNLWSNMMVGLSNPNNQAGYSSIKYAFYKEGGTFVIYESGTPVAQIAQLTVGDVIRIALEDHKINYYYNGNFVHSSNTAPSPPLIVDVTIYTRNHSIAPVTISRSNSLQPITFTSNIPDAPQYKWYINGVLRSTTTTSSVSLLLVAGDVVKCAATGSSGLEEVSGPINISGQWTSNSSVSIKTGDFTVCPTSEQVVWKDVVNAEITSNGGLICTTDNGWTVGGKSVQQITEGNGYVEYTIDNLWSVMMVGLSNPNTQPGYSTIQYAFYKVGNTFAIYESGGQVAQVGALAVNDVVRVAVEEGKVKYYQNSALVYTSNTPPTYPLIVDGTIYTRNHAIGPVTIQRNTSGTTSFDVDSPTAGTYQWYLNDVALENTGTSMSKKGLLVKDKVKVLFIPADQCSLPAVSGDVVISAKASSTPKVSIKTGDFTVCPTSEQVVWKDVVNAEITSNGGLICTTDNGWTVGGKSVQQITEGNGYVEYTIDNLWSVMMVGLSNPNTQPGYSTIQYAFYKVGNTFAIYESGGQVAQVGALAVNDVVRVAVEEGKVKYYQNSALVYTSNTLPTYPLIVDGTIYTRNHAIGPVTIQRNTSGTTSFDVDSPTAGTYQWYLNDVALENTGTSMSKKGLLVKDKVKVLFISAEQCSLPAVSDDAVISAKASATPLVSIDQGDFTVCLGKEPVIWKNVVNAAITSDGGLICTTDNGWTVGGNSVQQITEGNGYVEYTIDNLWSVMMVGLSNPNTQPGYSTIQYAFYKVGNTFAIYESGGQVAQVGALAVNDVVRVAVEEGKVKYYQNSALVYTSNTPPTYPLIVDGTIYTRNHVIGPVTIQRNTSGKTSFSVASPKAGTYQWYLNNVALENTGTSMSKKGLLVKDKVKVLFISADQCSLPAISEDAVISAKESSSLKVSIDKGDFTVCPGPEQVTWQDLVNATVTADGGLICTTDAGWTVGGKSVQQITEGNGYLEYTVDNLWSVMMVGLSNLNTQPGYSTIQYAFYKVGSTFAIYESGGQVAQVGALAVNDVVRVAVEEGKVKYYQNGALVYTSNTPPTYPLIVDGSIYTRNHVIGPVTIQKNNSVSVIFNATSALGTYQWYLNNTPIEGTERIFSKSGLLGTDKVKVGLVFQDACAISAMSDPVTIVSSSDCDPTAFKINTIDSRTFSFQFNGAGVNTIYDSPSQVKPPVTGLPSSIELKIAGTPETMAMSVYFDLDADANIGNLMYSLDGGTSKNVLPTSTYSIKNKELFLSTHILQKQAEVYPDLYQGKYLDVNNASYNTLKFKGADKLISTNSVLKLEVTDPSNQTIDAGSTLSWTPSSTNGQGLYKYKLTADGKSFEGYFVVKR